MNIDKQYLTISNDNRPGTRRSRTTAVACHYIGNPGTSAQANRNYFENLKNTHTTKASCHYIIGLKGEIIQLIPEEEISWCTNEANSYTISIEACHPDSSGKFTDSTYQSYVELAADICSRWGLDPQNGGLIRHYDVTRKVCPKWWVDHPEDWERFKAEVAAAMNPRYTEGFKASKDGLRWWYQYADGTFAANGWKWLTEQTTGSSGWYLFDAEGYMITGYQQDPSGEWFFLCPEGAHEGQCMVTDERGVLKIVGQYDFNGHKYIF